MSARRRQEALVGRDMQGHVGVEIFIVLLTGKHSNMQTFHDKHIQLMPFAAIPYIRDDVVKWEHFRVTGLCEGNSPLTRGEFTGHRWIPLTKASEAGRCDLRRNRGHYHVTVMLSRINQCMKVILIRESVTRGRM